ncbi:MAG: MATE family efflux transporter [Phycisphaeraceae bacterium]|nr:MAG: MATE family efflux transporter [Phycisphaeraceae bacterium]
MEGVPTSLGGGRERSPLMEMLAIAAPVVATMTSYTLMQFVDGLMVSRIGPDPIYVAAQGNGGVAAFVPISLVMGLITVVNTYVSQNLGAGRPERGAAYAWAGLWMCLLAWVALMLPFAAVIPFALERLSNHSDELLRMESAYARILLTGAIFTISARCVAQYFYGMHKPMIVLVAVLAGNAVNLVANSVLIFGPEQSITGGVLGAWFGMTADFADAMGIPRLGVNGAAISTVLGTIVELAIPMAIFLGRRMNALYGTRRACRLSIAHVRDIARIGWPGALMFGNEMICWSYLMAVLIGHFGEVHNTAGWIALRYMHLAFMPAIGISIAVTAQVGKCMGMKRPDLAVKRTMLGLGMTLGYMGVCALGFVLFRYQAIELFVEPTMDASQREELIAIGSRVMIAAAIFQLFDALGITMIGALRGAGDTIWPGVATIILAWVCIVGGGHLAIEAFPSLGSLGPWIGASSYIILLGVAVCFRFVQGKWKRIDLLRRANGPETPVDPAKTEKASVPVDQ